VETNTVLGMAISGGLNTDIKVEAFDCEGKSLGVYDNLSKASRALFIKYVSAISSYLNGAKGYTFTCKKKGVLSRKTGKRYHFKIVK
jgi:hypothetical protein